MFYKVTLVHREKIEVEADSPEAALKQAMAEGGKVTFAPQTQTVKEFTPKE